jgi:hypothetical protein
MLQCNDYVEQLETQQHVLQRSHEVEADRPTRGNCDAFADDRHGSGDSLAHLVAKEPPRSRPTCHRYSHAVPYPFPLRCAQRCVLKRLGGNGPKCESAWVRMPPRDNRSDREASLGIGLSTARSMRIAAAHCIACKIAASARLTSL